MIAGMNVRADEDAVTGVALVECAAGKDGLAMAAMEDRVSRIGDLSVFPRALDFIRSTDCGINAAAKFSRLSWRGENFGGSAGCF